MKYLYTKLIMIFLLNILYGQTFSISRVHYGGGGDWYSDPSSIPNLLKFLTTNTKIKAEHEENRIKLSDQELPSHPYLYLTGHGNIRLNDEEIIALRDHLLNGGFLHTDDNYGLNQSFRREMKRVFPNKDFVEIPHYHKVFHSYYDMPNGLPKIHEHDGKPAQALGLFEGERLIVFYTYETDLGDGWEDIEVHKDPQYLHEAALKMGVNIIWFALTQ